MTIRGIHRSDAHQVGCVSYEEKIARLLDASSVETEEITGSSARQERHGQMQRPSPFFADQFGDSAAKADPDGGLIGR